MDKIKHKLIPVLFFISTVAVSKIHAQTQTQFNHLAIVVKDLQQSKDFYAKALGFKPIEDPTGNPLIDWMGNSRGQQIHMLQGDMSAIQLTKSFHLSLAVEALMPIINRLKEHQIPYESWEGEAGKVTIRPDGVRQIYIQDPNGYWIEINDDWK